MAEYHYKTINKAGKTAYFKVALNTNNISRVVLAELDGEERITIYFIGGDGDNFLSLGKSQVKESPRQIYKKILKEFKRA